MTLIFLDFYYYFLWFQYNHFKLINKAIFKKIAFYKPIILDKKLFLISSFCFIFFLFFLKNILVFNAEKLMFIYFCLVVSIIIVFAKKIVNEFFQNESKKLLISLVNNELESEKKHVKMFILLKNMKIYIMK